MNSPRSTPHVAHDGFTDATLAEFEADVETALQLHQIPGAAVALVQEDEIVFARGFGVRDVRTNGPVIEDTLFRIASNTKSMTSLLAATFVDRGVFRWDTPINAIWPDFVAPTSKLTQTLRLRDLLGMASGVAESAVIEFFMSSGAESALDQLRSIAHLPVIAQPQTEYYYNNTLVSAAGYMGLIADGVPLERLEEEYAALMTKRVFAPTGMTTAAIADDPRPLSDNYATGSSRDMFGQLSPVPFVSIAGAAPAGAAIASAIDMGRYLIMHINGGVASSGTAVVSSTSLGEMHRPGIAVPSDAANALPAILLHDTVAMHYCLGWFDQTFKDGRHLFWHGGAIDGFGSQMGFFPAEKLGYVVLTNLEPSQAALFHVSIQSSLLGRLYGLNKDLPQIIADEVPVLAARAEALVAETQRVDPDAIGDYLGLYSDGFRLRLDDKVLRLEHDIRSMPMLALSDGSYVVTNGPEVVARKRITFAGNGASSRTMAIEGFEPIRWLTAG